MNDRYTQIIGFNVMCKVCLMRRAKAYMNGVEVCSYCFNVIRVFKVRVRKLKEIPNF